MLEIEMTHEGFVLRCRDTDRYYGGMSELVSEACNLATRLRDIFGLPDPDLEAITAETRFPGMVCEGIDSAIISDLPAEAVAYVGWIVGMNAKLNDIARRALNWRIAARAFHRAGSGDLTLGRKMQPARKLPAGGLARLCATPEWLETKQLCHLLQISRMTLIRRVRCGELPAPVKIGGRNRWRCDDILARFERLSVDSPQATGREQGRNYAP